MNPLRPIRAVLKNIEEENPDVKTYTLLMDDGYAKGAQPGQFNMLGYPGIGEAPISFSGLSGNGEVQHTIRSVGMATEFIERLEKGSSVLVRGPFGRGWPLHKAQGKDLVLAAGGIGLAPLRPVIVEVMARRKDFGSVNVLFGARNERGLIFAGEYEAWQEAGIGVHVTIDERVTTKPWSHGVGLITSLVGRLDMNAGNTAAFVCGPELMIRFVCRGLRLQGVPAQNLWVSLERRMKCGIAQCGHCQHVGLFVCKDGPVFPYHQVEGLYDGLL